MPVVSAPEGRDLNYFQQAQQKTGGIAPPGKNAANLFIDH